MSPLYNFIIVKLLQQLISDMTIFKIITNIITQLHILAKNPYFISSMKKVSNNKLKSIPSNFLNKSGTSSNTAFKDTL